MDELKCRKRVLRRLGYATSQDVIERKGRVACELSAADELLITEMLFNGLFNDLSGKENLLCHLICIDGLVRPRITTPALWLFVIPEHGSFIYKF